ncbi:hypothetical protein ACIPLA_11695 [Pseudomonas sp. NPDC086112]|uniref:hypothetical protein n=1 Tax=unclassified Pseudomonas TaxID=196821 RepID=UPI001C480EBA|nr:hypothetical protein [Pseudomonas sp. PDM24]MBV7497885.1 hypothetical protein [Pseudomonas sp. PDM24]
MHRTARPTASTTSATTGRPRPASSTRAGTAGAAIGARAADLRYSGAVTRQGCYGQ